jgi:hypothetical protein
MKIAGLVIVTLLAYGSAVSAQDEHAGHGGMGSTFGRVHFETSCSTASQEAFDRAVAILHSFFYPETEKAFRAIAEQEPGCAMAYWGLAISQRPNPLTAPFPQDLLKAGWGFIQQARAAATATKRERDWIEALALFYEHYDTDALDAKAVVASVLAHVRAPS